MATVLPVRTPITMPRDIQDRYLVLSLYGGCYVSLTAGDFYVEGTLLAVLRPNPHSDIAGVLVVIDAAGERVTGPVLAGDLLVV
jgi:hypothetical protein